MGDQEIKIPPQNIEAEMAVLGSMLIEEEAIPLALEFLDASCFYKEVNREIFSVITDLYNTQRSVDLITLSEELKRKNILESVGGVAYLTTLTEVVPTAANVQHYAGIVKEKSILRFLINNATQIVSECYDAKGAVEELLDRAEKLIFEISDHRAQGGYVVLKELIKDSIE